FLPCGSSLIYRGSSPRGRARRGGMLASPAVERELEPGRVPGARKAALPEPARLPPPGPTCVPPVRGLSHPEYRATEAAMHPKHLLARISFLIAPLVGCAQIPKAPEATPRTELEVAVRVDPTIAGMLHQSEDQESVERIVASTILSLADVGLRFYPVP